MEPHEYATMFSVEESYWWYRSLRRRIQRGFDDHSPAKENRRENEDRPARENRPARCIDAGCGSGMFLTRLDANWIGVGCDMSPIALAFARRRGIRELACASVEALPFADRACRRMVSADVLYHRGVRDDVAALREMARCLEPGGLLVINLPAFAWLLSSHDRAIHTARRYTAAEVRRKLRAAGLVPLRVRYWNWIFFPPLALVRWLRRGRSDSQAASDLTVLPKWLNSLLNGLMRIEEFLAVLPIPFGLSVIAIARKDRT